MSVDLLPASLACAAGIVLLTSLTCALYLEGLGWMLPGLREGGVCRRCRRGAVERVSSSFSGDRYYECGNCGARYKRSTRSGPWEDASAPEYDSAFLRETASGTRVTPCAPFDEETYWTQTINTLVWGKRSRDIGRIKNSGAGDGTKPGDVSPLWDGEIDGCSWMPRSGSSELLSRLTIS